jgi:hypothetical protein
MDASRHGALIASSLFIMPGTTIELAFIRKQSSKVIRMIRRWAKVERASRRDIAVSFVKPRRVPRASPGGVRPYSGRR